MYFKQFEDGEEKSSWLLQWLKSLHTSQICWFTFTCVAGHAGIKENEGTDQLVGSVMVRRDSRFSKYYDSYSDGQTKDFTDKLSNLSEMKEPEHQQFVKCKRSTV